MNALKIRTVSDCGSPLPLLNDLETREAPEGWRTPGRYRGFISLAFAAILFTALSVSAQTNGPIQLQPRSNVSLRNEVDRAIARGLEWLAMHQNSNGFWSTPDHPAVSGLALIAFENQPGKKTESATIKRGYDYLLSCVKSDGGLYIKELPNYNTAIALTALALRNRPDDRPIILKARNFLIGLQGDFGEKGGIDSPFDGGIGYGSKYEHSDLSNTAFALEALYYSRRVLEDKNLVGARELNWAAAVHFIQSCQNLPSHNAEKWASDDPENKGGFVYYPGNSMAGETNLPNGKVALRSYGSISYAGLLSYVYADLKRDDPRVIAVTDWLQNHFTLDENPGMGAQGLFYYYHMMAKALSSHGVETLELKNGQRVKWREHLALKLLNLQKADGSWVNDNGRWWEKDPNLVTAYTVIALELVQQNL